jgi:hypothetical protein
MKAGKQSSNTDVLESRALLKYSKLRQVLSSQFKKFFCTTEEWEAFSVRVYEVGKNK